MPAPGEPYRPLIALPEKVRDIDPWYADCSDAFFTAYDPPRTLVPVAAMVPETTTSSSASSPTPTPGPSLDIGLEQTTVTNKGSTITPIPIPLVIQPSKTVPLEQTPEGVDFTPQSELTQKQQGVDPTAVASDHPQSESVNLLPEQVPAAEIPDYGGQVDQGVVSMTLK